MRKTIIGVVAILVAILVGFNWGVSAGTRQMQREACMNGLADYDADENGDSQFIWAVPFGEMK